MQRTNVRGKKNSKMKTPTNKYQYETFEDWFNEVEGFVSERSDRYFMSIELYDKELQPKQFREMHLRWLTAAFECGRMKANEEEQ